jgi:hypothetical protein
MVALGQKQTFAAQKGMSALPPVSGLRAGRELHLCLRRNELLKNSASGIGRKNAPGKQWGKQTSDSARSHPMARRKWTAAMFKIPNAPESI